MSSTSSLLLSGPHSSSDLNAVDPVARALGRFKTTLLDLAARLH